jgi:hypothetical protein
MKKKPPAFQFYASDWLGSTRIELMSAEQERGYLRLLLHCWNDPTCSLADDDEVLSRLSKMGEGWFNGGSRLVRECFVNHPTLVHRIINEKLFEVYQNNTNWREKSRLGGIKSGESRRKSKRHKAVTSMKGGCDLVGTKPRTKCEPNTNTPSPSPNSTPIVPKGTYSSYFEDWWLQYPRHLRTGKQAACRAYQKAGKALVARNMTREQAVGFLRQRAIEFAMSERGQRTDLSLNPATWLNQGRYDDEAEAWNGNQRREEADEPVRYSN